MAGKYGEIDQVLMIRDETPAISYVKSVRRDNTSSIAHALPMLPMSRDILFRLRMPVTPKLLGALLDLNVKHHIEYMKTHHPWYMKATGKFWRFWCVYVSWRLRAEGTSWFE